MATVASLSIKLVGDVSSLNRALGQAKGALRSFGQTGKDALGVSFGNIISSGVTQALGAVTQLAGGLASVGAESIMMAADMEYQLDSISAVLNSSATETANLKKLIQDLALNPNLVVNAQEAATVIQNLATAGLTAQQILDGAAESTVLLANATGGDFGLAANVATDTMALFNIQASEMTKAINGVVAVSNVSKFGIQDYALALAQGGGVAAAVGVSLDDFNATIAAIAPSFSSGSDAGTSFKTFLQRLVPQSEDAVGAMRDLGLFTGLSAKEYAKTQDKIVGYQQKLAKLDPTSKNFAKQTADLTEKITVLQGSLVTGSNAFFDAEGNMRSMADIAGILNRATRDLTDEQRNNYLSTIFGTDAFRAASAIAGYTTEKFTELQATMAKTDAMEAARKRMDNLSGAWKVFQGIVESTKLIIGDAFIPTLTDLVNEGLVPAATAIGPLLTDWAAQLGAKFNDAVTGIMARAQEAQTLFNSLGGGAGGALAAAGQFVGATVTVDTEAKVTKVEWGSWTYTYDALAQVLEVDWVSKIGSTLGFTYDAKSAVTSVDWTSGVDQGGIGFTYDALAGITAVNWNGGKDGFTYIYDAKAGILEVDWGAGRYTHNYTADVTINSVLWGIYYGHYEANAGVTDVVWGVYTHTYQPNAEITSVLWGAFSHSYLVATEVRSVLWGLWEHSYNTQAKISESSVAWGLYSHQYDGTVKIGETGVAWGLYTHTYDAQAQVGEKSLLWGLWTWTYDAKANITSVQGQETGDFILGVVANVKSWTGIDLIDIAITAPEWLPSLTVPSPSWLPLLTIPVPVFDWPALPTFTWPALPTWSWPTLPTFTWPTLPTFTWPALPTWKWPSIPSLGDDWWPDFPTPSWLATLANLINQAKSVVDLNPFNALGTSYWSGGRTWVGENGPELVTLPRGSQITSATESRALMMNGGGGGPAVVIQQAVIRDERDIYDLAYRVDDLRRRRRR